MSIPGFVPGIRDDQANIYLSWLRYMLSGQMREADMLFAQYSMTVVFTALDVFTHAQPWPMNKTRRCYRGVLLDDPNIPYESVLPYFDQLPAFSYSEDKNIACHFANPNGFGVAAGLTLPDHGYVLESDIRGEAVLFHWSYFDKYPILRRVFPEPGGIEALKDQKEVTVLNSKKLRQYVYPWKEYCGNYKVPRSQNSSILGAVTGRTHLWES